MSAWLRGGILEVRIRCIKVMEPVLWFVVKYFMRTRSFLRMDLCFFSFLHLPANIQRWWLQAANFVASKTWLFLYFLFQRWWLDHANFVASQTRHFFFSQHFFLKVSTGAANFCRKPDPTSFLPLQKTLPTTAANSANPRVGFLVPMDFLTCLICIS